MVGEEERRRLARIDAGLDRLQTERTHNEVRCDPLGIPGKSERALAVRWVNEMNSGIVELSATKSAEVALSVRKSQLSRARIVVRTYGTYG